MTTRRLDVILPLITLVVSFGGVLALGEVFARHPDALANTQVEIALPDLQVADPAPGLIRIKPSGDVANRRICLTEIASAHWKPTDPKNWTNDGAGMLCRPADGGPSSSNYVIVLVKR